MPVHKISATELLGGKSRVMFATPALVAALKKHAKKPAAPPRAAKKD